MLWITLILLFMVLNAVLFSLYYYYAVSKDFGLINKLGIIRGSIQRISKLEMNGIENDAIIAEIDGFFDEMTPSRAADNSLSERISSLRKKWVLMKDAMYSFRDTRNPAEGNGIYKMSEDLWNEANEMVFSAEIISEKKLVFIRFVIIVLFCDVLLVVLIVFLIRRYVKGRLEILAVRDSLTGIYNYNFLQIYISTELEKARRYETGFSVVLFDIDKFKSVNDVYGHDWGNLVLKEITALVPHITRKSDVFVRIGGDEFLIILSRMSLGDAVRVAEKIRLKVGEHRFERIGTLTLSLGVTEFSKSDTFDTLFKRADEALYESKRKGRNAVSSR